MHSIHRRRRSAGRITGMTAAVLAATVGLALGTALPAGASRPWGPHDTGQIHAAAAPEAASARAHALTPLTLANIVVTPVGSSSSSFRTFRDPAPGSGAGCTSTASTSICLTFGTGQPGGGQFSMNVPSFSPGHVYTEQDGTISVSSGTVGCSATAANDSAGLVEVNQYLYTSGGTPVQAAAVQFDCTSPTVDITGTIAYNIVPSDPVNGYYVFGQQGEITGFGNDNYLAYLDGAQYYNLNSPIVGMAPTPTGTGYWMVGADGGVFASGTAGFYGSTGSIHLNAPIVGMAATPSGNGYWFVASDGGIFAYGDAQFYGSMGGQHLNKPIVGMAATPSGHGYWLVASDGGIFAYGDAGFYGSTGAIALNKPVVGMVPTPTGHGYWFTASDGGIFAYGDAQFYGSTGSIHLNSPIVGMTATHSGHGYWFTASDGGVFNYGDAGFAGSLGGSGVSDVAGISLGAGANLT